MNKLIFVALAVFCVAADVTVNYPNWVTYPSVILNINNKADQALTNSTYLGITAANGTLLVGGATPFGNQVNTTVRTLKLDNYNTSANDDAQYTMAVPTANPGTEIPTFNGLQVYAQVSAINNINQVVLVRTYLGNATVPNVQLTANANTSLTYNILSGWYANQTYWVLFQEKNTGTGAGSGNLLLGGVREDSTAAYNLTIVYNNTDDDYPTVYQAAGATIPGTSNAYVVFSNGSWSAYALQVGLGGNGTTTNITNYFTDGTTQSSISSINVFPTNNYVAAAVVLNDDTVLIRTTSDLTKNVTVAPNTGVTTYFITAQPYYDNVALFWKHYNAGTYSYAYQLYDGQNFTTNGTEVTLISGFDNSNYFNLIFTQYGSGYGYWYNTTYPYQAVWLGQFFNRTHDAATLLQTAVYVCGALLAALFAF